MFFSSQRLPVCWTGFCIALAGAVYCAAQVAPLPVAVPCPGTGCRIFQDFSIQGISLWWFGAAYFAFMVILCLRRARAFALLLSGTALVIDGLLLVVMLATASCIACLGGGAIIALLYYVIRKHSYSRVVPAPGASIVLLAWGGLFIAALAFAGTEELGPWQLTGKEHPERRVYFSPSCPACRDAIAVFAGNATFIPVAEQESDYGAIHGMEKALAEGKTLTEALEIVTKANGTLTEPSFPKSLVFRVKLLRNKAEVLRLGFDQLPLVMINGMPQSLRPASAPKGYNGAPARAPSSALPPELAAPLDSCGDGTPVPCDPPL